VAGYANRDVNRALKERLAQVQSSYERIRDGMADLRAQMGAMTATVSSPGGLVEATVDARGQLIGLAITHRAMREMDHDQLASTVVATAGKAATRVAEQVAGLLEQFSPMASGVAAFVRSGSYDDLLRRTDEATGWQPFGWPGGGGGAGTGNPDRVDDD
jgi:DNA-binding protein YbaB